MCGPVTPLAVRTAVTVAGPPIPIEAADAVKAAELLAT